MIPLVVSPKKSLALGAFSLWFFVVGIYFYWFAMSNRYTIFLYTHLGAGPFDARTISRYWMSGLVVSGGAFLFYVAQNWFFKQLAAVFYKVYEPPPWWQLWLVCSLPLFAGILAVTTTMNWPTLPLSIGLKCTAVTLSGLALALFAGTIAFNQPVEFSWLLLTAVGLMPIFLLLRAVELPNQGLVPATTAYSLAFGGTTAGMVWAISITWIRTRFFSQADLSGFTVFLLGLFLSYLLLPFAHYLLFTPPTFRYISSSANFFAFNPSIQLVTLILGLGAAVGLGKLNNFMLKTGKKENRE